MKQILLAAAVLAAAPAHAQSMHCDAYDVIVEMLTTGFGESVLERGLDHGGSIAEWWGNPDTGTWTLVTVSPSGMACLPAHGTAFETLEPEPAGTDG